MLNNNQITGLIPSEIGNLTNLTELILYNNQFSGEIPDDICNFDGYLDLSFNELCPPYPECLSEEDIGTQDTTNCNNPPSDFSLLTPEDGDTVYINSSNQNDSLIFQWEESIDPDGDMVHYFFELVTVDVFIGGYEVTTLYADTVDDTLLSLANNFIADITGIEVPDDTLEPIYFGWGVISSDGIDYSPEYSHKLIIDFSGYLQLHNEIVLNSFTTYPAYPNPFNPVITLRYDIPEDAMVDITIYDMMGRIINNLLSSQQTAGYKSVQWNATNNSGQPISAGLLIYMVQAGEFRQTKKMVLLK